MSQSARRGVNLAAFAATVVLGKATREFKGDGTPILKTPGLKELHAVKIGQQEIPLKEERTYPTDASGHNFEKVEEEITWREVLPNDEIAVCRSILSNDGIWQKDATVYITGEWEVEPTQAAEAEQTEQSEAPASSADLAALLNDENGDTDENADAELPPVESKPAKRR